MTVALYAIGCADLALAGLCFVALVRDETTPAARHALMVLAGFLAASGGALFICAAGAP